MKWTLEQIVEKKDHCRMKMREFEKLACDTNDDDERSSYISLIGKYKEMYEKAESYLAKRIQLCCVTALPTKSIMLT